MSHELDISVKKHLLILLIVVGYWDDIQEEPKTLPSSQKEILDLACWVWNCLKNAASITN